MVYIMYCILLLPCTTDSQSHLIPPLLMGFLMLVGVERPLKLGLEDLTDTLQE